MIHPNTDAWIVIVVLAVIAAALLVSSWRSS